MKTLSTPYDKSIKILILGVLSFFIILVFRLFYLQIWANHEFFARAQKNFSRTHSIKPQRGNILDCNGQLLATNRSITSLYWQGTGNKTLTSTQLDLLKVLQEITTIDLFDELTLQAIKFAEKTGRKKCLADAVSLLQLSQIMERFPNEANLAIEKEFKRFYPHTTLACHVLGYIGAMHIESTGKMGLEKILEHALKGEHGKLFTKINSFGTNLYQEEVQQALQGQTIQTTLDLSLQTIAEQSFDQNLTGALILLDPSTGAIKALLSRPTFDPSLFLEPLSSQDWFDLQQKKPFLNRAFNAAYPPASLFKLVTLSAALELDIVNKDTITECKGFVPFGGRRYHCAKRAGHGELSISEWIAKSCNIPFYEIGKQIAIDDLAHYAQCFGLGQKTNIIFNEAAGLVPTSAWKVETKGERWWPGETLSATIGQSYYLTTPIQIARMIGSIFTGYLITPRILEQEPISQQPLCIKPETRKILKHSLKTVVTQGTGATINTIEDIKIYAKTGTAQISSLAKRWHNEALKEHAWLVAHFRYKNYDPLVMVLLIEHGGTYRTATSIAKRFLTKYRTHLKNT